MTFLKTLFIDLYSYEIYFVKAKRINKFFAK